MNSFMYDNYDYFVRIKPKNICWFYLLVFMILVLSIYSFTMKSSDVFETKSYYECVDECYLYVEAPLTSTNDYANADEIKINDNMVTVLDAQVGDVKTDDINKTNYQLITYTISNQDIINKTYNDVKIFYNEELIFNKIINCFIK